MLIKRDLEDVFHRFTKFPVVAILGPRQSGKTTISQKYFKNHLYLNFEHPDNRNFAKRDPEGFLREHENKYGLILDEFQYVPEILSYIQLESDAKNRPGYFVLSGSQNFLMNQTITQSLAGRVGILTLLPFSYHELASSQLLPDNPFEAILLGSYPRIYSEHIAPRDFYPGYINTYLEQDVRQLVNVGDLSTFQMFLTLCAGRIGQIINLADIAMNCGISGPTAKRWLSILEASYIIFHLQPYFKNFNKRVIKRPKLYFYDTGLACDLLRLKSAHDVNVSAFKGALFENAIISDLHKQYHNDGDRPATYFWRDKNGRLEIDCLIDKGNYLVPIEIKSGQTINRSFFNQITEWNIETKTSDQHNSIIYAGTKSQKRKAAKVIAWKDTFSLISKLYQ